MGLPNQEPKRIADTSSLIPGFSPVPLKKAATLSNLWGTFVETKNPAPNTLEDLRHIGRRILTFFREKELNVSTMMEWNKFVRSIKTNGKPIGVGRIFKINTVFRGFLRFIKKLGFIQHDLWEFVELPKLPDPKLPDILTDEEYQRVKDSLKNAQALQWALWMIILGYRTGMSMCDCAHLRWEQVFLSDTGESYMDVQRIKLRRFGEKGVCRIPIVPNSDLHEWLLKLKADQPNNYKRHDGLNYVHQDCPGYHNRGPVTHRMMTVAFSTIFKKAGLPGKTFASLRRTFISNLVNAGMDYALVCKITGHTNLKTLLGYLRPDRKALQDGVMKAQQYAEGKIS